MSEYLEDTEENNLTSVSIRAVDLAREDDELSPEYSPNGRYRKLCTLLGTGTFKNVYKAIDEEEGKEVAWNSLQIKDYETAQEDRITYLEEIKLLKSISHPNIIELYDFWFTDNNFVFITELMTSGTLRDYIRNVKDMNIKIIRKWSKQILEGISYLHNLNPMIIHRDIKCENIFVNGATGVVKIGDLGIAKRKDVKRYTMVGTPEFMAREIFEGDGYSEKVDVYAFGMCLLEMATGKSPYFELKSTAQIFRNILKGVLPEGIKEVKFNCLKSLILECLSQELKRPTVKECLNHHFFQQDFVCGGKCFQEDSTPAISQSDVEILMRYGPSNIVRCQIYFNSYSRYITFKYNPDFDTPEGVSQEMVDQGLIEQEKKKKISDIMSNTLRDLQSCTSNQFINIASPIKYDTPDAKMKSENELYSQDINKCYKGENQSFFLENLNSSEGSNLKVSNADSLEVRSPENEHTIAHNIEHSTSNCEVSVIKQILSSEIPDSHILKDQETFQSNRDQVKTVECVDFPGINFPDSMSIENLAIETALVTKRDEETAKEWIETFKIADIETIGELRILTQEDWNSLKLTVFGARAIKNMLFDKNSHPVLEKDLLHNKNIKIYDDNTTIQKLLNNTLCSKSKAVKRCEDKLRAQDIRTIGELRSLHEDDWNKLGLSVLANRVLKNSIMRRGKTLESGLVVH